MSATNIRTMSDNDLKAKREGFLSERLLAYREDLAEWFAGLFKMDITESTLMADLGASL